MVSALVDLNQGKGNNQRRKLIVEIVGLPGTGKSTLFRSLLNDYPWIKGEFVPQIRDFSMSLFYFKNFLYLFPTLIRLQVRNDRLISYREIIYMILLNGWYKLLQKRRENSKKDILIDQGPISLIGYLLNWGPKILIDPVSDEWWDKVFNHWSHNLDMIIYIDTSNDTLIDRIRSRYEADHEKMIFNVNKKSVLEANAFLETCRCRYQQIISRLVENNQRLYLVTIDSGENSPDMIVKKVISEFEASEWEL